LFCYFVSQERFTPYYKTAGGERVPITRLQASSLVLGYKVKAGKGWGHVFDFMKDSDDLLPEELTPAKAAKASAAKKPAVPSDSDDSSLEPEDGVAKAAAAKKPAVPSDSDDSSLEPEDELEEVAKPVTKAAGGDIVLTPPDDIEAVTEQTAEMSIVSVDLDLSSFTIVAKDLEPSVDI
jgi:hypothetical protein